MLTRPATHVIFDLDGVLLDTEPLYARATQQIVATWGKRFDWSLKANMIGRDSRESARYLIAALDLPISPEEYLSLRRQRLVEWFPDVDALPGARELVEALAALSVPMAVATSAERALTELKLTRHAEWFGLFQHVVCGDDAGISALKPAPDIFLLAAQRLGAAPRACLVFEDSPAGVEAALAAGMQVIALPDPGMDRSRYPGATAVISGYGELSLAALGFGT